MLNSVFFYKKEIRVRAREEDTREDRERLLISSRGLVLDSTKVTIM